MKRVIFFRLLAVSAVAVLISGLLTGFLLNRQSERIVRENITTILKVASLGNPNHPDKEQFSAELSAMCEGYRITVITVDGVVLGDSQLDAPLENHLHRPEVEAAIQNGYAHSKRFSATTGRNYLYVAVKTQDGMILRAAAPLERLGDNLLSLVPAMLLSMGAALIFASVIAGRATKTSLAPIETIVRDISQMDTGSRFRLELPDYEELSPLVRSFNSLTERIAVSLGVLENEKDKLEFLLDSMQQGLVVVDANLKVLHHNEAAMRLLGSGEVSMGQSLFTLTHNRAITSAVESSLAKRSIKIFDIEDQESVYQIAVSYLSSEWIPSGVMLIITDITQEYRSQQIRREFVANASHELKTPITSIKGFAELLATGLLDDKEQQAYFDRILKESERMTTLIGDILKLSELEEGGELRGKTEVDLLVEARQVCKDLSHQADAKHITVGAEGTSVPLFARQADIRQLLVNLVENAVKYNKENGSVTVRVSQSGNNAKLVVADTGIGIPQGEFSRIFERFYRVDKGRSRAVGGTGLGLAIVKHIVSSYEGEITVKSRPGIGTEITVTLPLRV